LVVDSSPRRAAQWISWFLGAGILVTVIVAALHFSEGREFAQLLEEANPWWLLLAFLLQGATYFAQAEVFRGPPRAAGFPLSRGWLYQLAFGKLVLDQALPSGGISSTVLVARALQDRGVAPGAVAGGALINIVSYHAAYVVLILVALGINAILGKTNVLILLVSVLFVAFGIALTVVVLALSGRRSGTTAKLERFPLVKNLVGFLAEADLRLLRNPRLLSEAAFWQATIFLLDAATMWVLVRSLGATASGEGVFASFMISSVFRTIGVVPGGLGTYEATSVLTLRMIGVSIPIALSATLVFRGLSFWLPMLPGLWFTRRVTGGGKYERSFAGLETYWSLDREALAARLESELDGLSSMEAEARLRRFGPNQLQVHRRYSRARLLAEQLRNPLLLVLVFAAIASAWTGDWVDSAIVLAIISATVGISYSREYSAQTAVAALQGTVRTRTSVVRSGRAAMIPVENVVPGDVVLLSAGSIVPADAVILEANDFFVSEAVLTGESFPVEKEPGVVNASATLAERTNCVFFGTNVRGGSARCIVVETGRATQFGAIAARLSLRPPETEFDRGVRRFGHLLTSTMVILVFLVFLAHVLRGRPPVETLLFSVALAVGLSPELLPAILSVNLARGAQTMARRGVVVRRLNAIENLGSMDVLCTDKTGTLTEGVVQLEGAYDASGAASTEVLRLGALNAALETGLHNPLDEAIILTAPPDLSLVSKIGEIPFDFVRKRVSVIVQNGAGIRLITKGAFNPVLEACSRSDDGSPLDDDAKARLQRRYDDWSARGIRVLAIAVRNLDPQPEYGRDDESDLAFFGFLTFLDRPKEGVAAAIADLARLGVSIKLITGDNKLVAQHVASLVGLPAQRVLSGKEIQNLNDEALWNAAERTDLFVEVDPNQKERVILSLKKMGHVVGFLGDGVNDAPAMHAADTSLSVDEAVDVAREAADFVLLERNLDVIRRGVEEGRKTFANTLKYVLTTMSANLGNMLSMTGASLFLPFLPLLPSQILLNNFLSDVPAIGLADDSVDPELVRRPERWNTRFIGRFMVEFGILSSAFDFLTFAALLSVFHASPDVFRTAWFVESLLTELVIALVVRTRRLFFRSRPSNLLLASTLVLIPFTLALPYLPLVRFLGFVPLPPALLMILCAITGLYVLSIELLKRWFFRSAGLDAGRRPWPVRQR
jgi:Mg2+-importing ATPase